MRQKQNRNLGIALIITILVLNSSITLAAAQPSEPHAADAMWVEPSTVTFNGANGTLGTTFNVTVSLNMTETIFSWQMVMHYNRNQLKATNAGYTAGGTSEYCAGHTTISPAIVIDGSAYKNGSVLASESLEDSDTIPGPHSGTLIWVEFQIMSVPTYGNLTSQLDISSEYAPGGAGNTYVLGPPPTFTGIDFTPYNGTYTFIGPSAPPPLSVTISANSTSIYAGQSVNLTSTVNGGISPYTYQWLLNSTASGVTTPNWTYTPSNATYSLISLNVTDSNGTTTESNTIAITVLPPLAGAKIFVDPSQIIDLSMGPGSIFSINITVANVQSLGGCVFNLTYDPTVLDWIGFDFLQAQGEYPTAIITGDTITGFAWISLYYLTPITVLSLPLTRMRFYVNTYGISPLNLTDTELLDQNGNPIVHNEFDGIFANIIRDVAVTNVVPSLTWLYQTWVDNINVTVANLGNVSETFTATAYYNGTAIGTVPITNLASGAQTTVTIPWDTTGVAQGNYTISAFASYVPYEEYFNEANNFYTDGIVQVFTVIHDVAVTAVVPTVSWAYVNSTVPVNVTVADLGNVSESFTVTAYYGANITIGMLPVTSLASGTNATLIFNWNTTGITTEANYTLSAFASYVPFEYNLTNNYLIGGQVLILTQIRDVAITNVTAASYWAQNWAYQGGNMNITVTANNTGQVPESFYVSALWNGTLIGNVSVSLAPGAGINEIFALNTSSLPLYQDLNISGQASFVQYEYNLTNNFYVDSNNVTIRFLGDVNGDGKVDGRDITIIASAFGTVGPNFLYPGSPPSPNWNIACDLNADNKVDGRDLTIAASNFGESYP
jgi:hypothetical protein